MSKSPQCYRQSSSWAEVLPLIVSRLSRCVTSVEETSTELLSRFWLFPHLMELTLENSCVADEARSSSAPGGGAEARCTQGCKWEGLSSSGFFECAFFCMVMLRTLRTELRLFPTNVAGRLPNNLVPESSCLKLVAWLSIFATFAGAFCYSTLIPAPFVLSKAEQLEVGTRLVVLRAQLL